MNAFFYAYDSVKDAKVSIQKYWDWYNQERPDSNLNRILMKPIMVCLLSSFKEVA